MKRLIAPFCIAILVACATGWVTVHRFQERREHRISARIDRDDESMEKSEAADNDWFMAQRSYPHNDIPHSSFNAMRPAMKQFLMEAAKQHPRSPESTPQWVPAGPTNIGGRVNAIAINPKSGAIYAAAASGGVWKSTDFGETWNVVFEQCFSIGTIVCDQSNPNELYIGTGEANPSSTDTYPGNGVWRSTDAGNTWTNLGLAELGHIGKIVINPKNKHTIFVAGLGLYRGKTADRGIYKSTNYGVSWNKILYVSDTTGAADVVMDLADTNIIVASTWTYYRTLPTVQRGGVGSAIYYSSTGGASWEVAAGSPEGDPNTGRITFAQAHSDPTLLYALVTNNGGSGWGGVYKSFDHGASWLESFTNAKYSETQVWYNNVLAVNPVSSDELYAGMTNLYHSGDGGGTFDFAPGLNQIHVDFHALEYWPGGGGDTIIAGCDGGVYTSNDGGNDWSKCPNLPITQFYAGNISPHTSAQLFGGAQDNGCNRTFSNSPDEPWDAIYGGDGFYVVIDPSDPHYVYAESQNGGMGYSLDGGGSFRSGTNGLNLGEPFNWCTPIALDPHSPKTLYTGSNSLYKTTENMQYWTKIGPNLTYNKGSFFSNVTTIDVSPADGNIVWAGTGDGRVWNTLNAGTTFTERTGTLPMHWVTRVTADPESANVAYVTLSGFREYEWQGHLYRTRDYGATWQNIGSGLPDIPLNDVLVDPDDESTLYVATDLNVLVTNDLGVTWSEFGSGLPAVPVHDLSINKTTRTLAAFTHGRSAYVINMPPPKQNVVSFSINAAWNLVSNPFTGNNDSVNVLFPGAASKAFAYTNTYIEAPRLSSGLGYWLKFDAPGLKTLSGKSVQRETVAVHTGWNIIGSLGSNLPVTNIKPVNTTISSQYFSYSAGYAQKDTLAPGRGYWIKVSADGTLILGSAPATN